MKSPNKKHAKFLRKHRPRRNAEAVMDGLDRMNGGSRFARFGPDTKIRLLKPEKGAIRYDLWYSESVMKHKRP